jgi:hypothetical protein
VSERRRSILKIFGVEIIGWKVIGLGHVGAIFTIGVVKVVGVALQRCNWGLRRRADQNDCGHSGRVA